MYGRANLNNNIQSPQYSSKHMYHYARWVLYSCMHIVVCHVTDLSGVSSIHGIIMRVYHTIHYKCPAINHENGANGHIWCHNGACCLKELNFPSRNRVVTHGISLNNFTRRLIRHRIMYPYVIVDDNIAQSAVIRARIHQWPYFCIWWLSISSYPPDPPPYPLIQSNAYHTTGATSPNPIPDQQLNTITRCLQMTCL